MSRTSTEERRAQRRLLVVIPSSVLFLTLLAWLAAREAGLASLATFLEGLTAGMVLCVPIWFYVVWTLDTDIARDERHGGQR